MEITEPTTKASDVMSAEDFADKISTFIEASFWKHSGRKRAIEKIKQRDADIRAQAVDECNERYEAQKKKIRDFYMRQVDEFVEKSKHAIENETLERCAIIVLNSYRNEQTQSQVAGAIRALKTLGDQK